jgi:hypothetical protein
MKSLMITFGVAALLLAGCDKPQSAQPAKATNDPVGSNPLNAPTDYLGAMGRAKKSAEKTVDLAALKQAVNLFYAQEDRYPKDLQELVTMKYLGALPPPPVGMKITYNASNGEVAVVPK